MIAAGHIATELAQGNNCRVNPLEAEALQRVYEVAANAKQLAQTVLPEQGAEQYAGQPERPFYEPEKIGNSETIDAAHVGGGTSESAVPSCGASAAGRMRTSATRLRARKPQLEPLRSGACPSITRPAATSADVTSIRPSWTISGASARCRPPGVRRSVAA